MEIEIVPTEKIAEEKFTPIDFLKHFSFWAVYTIYDHVIEKYGFKNHDRQFVRDLLNHILIAAFFYANALFVLPKFYKSKQYLYLFLAMLGLILAFTVMGFCLVSYIFPSVGVKVPYHALDIDFFILTIYNINIYLLYSIGYFFARESNRLEKEKLHMTKKLFLTELQFLRAQINPHFLYNTLNYIYLQAKNVSFTMGESVMQLANLMRASLRPKGNYSNLVDLGKELDYLDAFIKMQQMRYNWQLNVYLNRQGNFEGRLFIPMILVSFVENAFKHGELNDPENPVIFEAFYTEETDTFRFNTFNIKNTDIREFSSGIGYTNMRERLDILYPKRYKLTIEQDEINFSANLTVILN